MTRATLSLLDEPIIGTETRDGGVRSVSLPGLLAAFVRDEIATVTAVRAHQRHAFHATTVQIAAICLDLAGRAELPEDEATWRDLLVQATPDEYRDTAWCLVAPDGEPAFLQPAILAGGKDKEKVFDGAGELDILVTSRNHDVKIGAAYGASSDEWLASLVSLQTQGGFSGPGNVGVARMNSGFGSRSGFGLVPPGGPGARFARDVRVHLAKRADVLARYPFRKRDGSRFLWLDPWVGNEQIAISDLDPYFVEVARRVRLAVTPDGRMFCRAWNNDKPRVAAAAARGDLGDLWTVTAEDKDGLKAFTGEESGLPYGRLVDLIFGGKTSTATLTPAPLSVPAPGDPAEGMRFSARMLVRGQGKTEGYHERTVPLAAPMIRRMARKDASADVYGSLARSMVKAAGDTDRKSLSIALMQLAQGGDGEKADFKDTGVVRLRDRWIARYHARVDVAFFPSLALLAVRMSEGSSEREVLDDWFAMLFGFARDTWRDATVDFPGKAVHRARSVARSETKLEWTFKPLAPDVHGVLFPSRKRKVDEDETMDTPDTETADA